MIKIKNVNTLAEKSIDIELPGINCLIDAEGKLTLLPALIAPYVQFETWQKGAQDEISNGITTVIEISNDCHTKEQVQARINFVNKLLDDVKIPLHYHTYLQADENHVAEIGRAKKLVKGVNLVPANIHSDQSLEKIFQIAAMEDLIVVLPAENNTAFIRKGIEFTEKYDGQLLLLEVSTEEELNLVRDAKSEELLVYADAILNDNEIIWQGIRDGTIDMLGHSRKIRGLEAYLPLLLNASHQKKINLEVIVALTKTNIESIFDLQPSEDFVLVDLNKSKEFPRGSGITLQGWPVYTLLKGQVFKTS